MPETEQPNILVIWGDDIGISNLSCYSDGLMGYRTPNIDRIAEEGMRFTDSYGEQSCTAGRASFITGQSVFRTGLSKVGLPGADVGLRPEDPTIAELLKPLGYATGQFGKNHLGDKNEFLPTVHGFDEFFGNLYHLNAEEEPELPHYPPAEDFPAFRTRFGPRGVLHSWATDADDDHEDGRFGRVGKQRIEDTGPLTKKRMETIDDETVAAAADFIGRAHEAGTPFFVWMNTTHMHLRTHTKPESLGQAGRWQSPYHDTMIDHDRHVGLLLERLDELGLSENTIVVYSTDNGPHMNSWPDGGMTPFRNEKNSNWEGAFRVPEIIRWPGHIPAGVVSNEIVQHHDWLPTLLAAAGDSDVVEECKKGKAVGDVTYRVHIDGYDILPYLTGQEAKSPRQGMVYFSDDGDVLALRFDNWKVVFMEQRTPGTLQVWSEPFVPLRIPKLYNLPPTRTSARTSRPTRTTTGSWTMPTWCSRPKHSWSSSSPPSASSRPARRPPASRSTRRSRSSRPRSPPGTEAAVTESVPVPAGHYLLGSDSHDAEEGPARHVRVDAFWMAARPVTNRQYARFVAETGYATVAERPLDPADFPGAPPENLVPGSLVFTRTTGPVDLRHLSQWWTWTPGACWRRPEGPGSTVEDRGDHPVVHVAFEDAIAYCDWAGTSLPTEAQWEVAARGGLEAATYTWGDEPERPGERLANYWHGDFPWRPEPGYGATTAVGSFPPNGYGLYDMAGNVWEWTTDFYADRPRAAAESPSCCAPTAAAVTAADSLDPAQPQFGIPRRVIKGGSFLCADPYCLRYRPAARRPQMIDTGMSHVGFRCCGQPTPPALTPQG